MLNPWLFIDVGTALALRERITLWIDITDDVRRAIAATPWLLIASAWFALCIGAGVALALREDEA